MELEANLDTEDLRKFLVIAKHNNLQQASATLNVTPGALSKVIKRLEIKLNTQLFKRIGRNIKLNQQGEKFRHYALNLVHEADQAISEFNGSTKNTVVNLSGPSLLLQHYLPFLLSQFNEQGFQFNIDTSWEGQAIEQVARGHAHLALVTEVALNESTLQSDFERIYLGTTTFKVVAAHSHPLFEQFSKGSLTNRELFQFSFACPSISPFCGVTRGVGSDGWRDDKVPRTISYRCNDFSTLLSLVKQGIALAYVPDFIANDPALKIIDVLDCNYTCQERLELVYKPSLATGWLNQFAAKVRAAHQRIA